MVKLFTEDNNLFVLEEGGVKGTRDTGDPVAYGALLGLTVCPLMFYRV